MINIPVAIQLYSLRGEMAKDFEGTLKAVSEMGYKGVEFAGTYGKSADEIKTLCEKYDLVPVSAHISYDELLDGGKTIGEFASIGCRFAVIPWIGSEYRPGGSKHAEFIENVKKIGKLCHDNNMTLLYHNHWFEFENEGDKYFLDSLYDSVSHELLSTELDTCWVNIGGENPVDYIKKYSNRAPVVHLKDFRGNMSGAKHSSFASKIHKTDSDFEFMPLGQGFQDIEAIVTAANESGTEWLVYEQDSPTSGKSSLECAKESINYLRSLTCTL